MMTGSQKKKLLEFCGWTLRDKDEELPEITCDFLFKYFVSSWNRKNPKRVITRVAFHDKYCEIGLWDGSGPYLASGTIQSEAFAEACIYLLERK